MARPKGSKNKTTEQETAVQQPAPVPFNYEEDDAKFDASYQMRFQDPSYAAAAPAVVTLDLASFEPKYIPTNEINTFTLPNAQVSKLFLVEGEVQLSSRVPGRGVMVAKQMRLVEAPSDDIAIQKYVTYFNGLSDAQSVYTVMNAAAMETIR